MSGHYRNTDELKARHAELVGGITATLASFRAVPPERYFYELCFCLMTPQSSAANAFNAQQALEELRFFDTNADPEPILRRSEYYIRFHTTKARRLISAKTLFPDVMSVIASPDSAFEKREWLVGHVNGLSYKESTHFLRNIGSNDGLAILDVHILRCLVKHGVIDEIPSSLSKAHYLRIESLFQKFAAWLSIPIDHLDLVFWSGATGFILK
jgi:N-glycosylase/DNA lyase